VGDDLEWLHNDWGIIVSVLAGVVWLLRLEGRVGSHEKVCEELQKQAQEARALTRSSLQRIEDRLVLLADRIQGTHDTHVP
jgi:hypothetical protein